MNINTFYEKFMLVMFGKSMPLGAFLGFWGIAFTGAGFGNAIIGWIKNDNVWLSVGSGICTIGIVLLAFNLRHSLKWARQ